jgi:hypothetical protein
MMTGTALTKDEMDDVALDLGDDDEDDSDYEFNAGDMGLYYESRLEDKDEFVYLRDGL